MALICFDLDGTLVDPLASTMASLASACTEFGISCPRRECIAARIGLDLADLFPELPPPRQREVLLRFEHHFEEEGVFEQRILDGVHAILVRLKRQGHRLFLAASLPTSRARRTLHHFDLLLAFDGIAGLVPAERWKSKREILETLRLEGFFRTGGCFIGDRADDVLAARALGLRAVGVSYGFGSREELKAAKADFLLHSVQELDDWLEKEYPSPEIHDPFSRSE